jgi:aminoglycoside phosphotransferase (APT) family kinase protein
MDKTRNNFDNILNKITKELNISITKITESPKGMDSEIVSFLDENNKEYVVKIGEGVEMDIRAYDLIKKNNLNIPIPKVYLKASIDDIPVLVMEKIQFPLLESVAKEEIPLYIPSMIESLRVIHSIGSDRVGYITNNDERRNWKEFHLSKFDSTDEYLKWDEISKRKGLDKDLILKSVDMYISKFLKVGIREDNYCLLHTDYNQRNLFVNPKTNNIAGIIDWGESMFGDPIYDFSRIRMLIWHFDLGDKVVDEYYSLMSYTKEEKELDELYWVSRIIEYLAYYSEELNEFNRGRIEMHEGFLRGYVDL